MLKSSKAGLFHHCLQLSALFLSLQSTLATPLALALTLPDDYQERRASQKQAILWDEIIRTQYDSLSDKPLPPLHSTGLGDLTTVFVASSLFHTFEHASDVFPARYRKSIHKSGVTAKIIWKTVNEPSAPNPFSGYFAANALGLIRLSLAEGGLPFTPGAAVKLFRDGIPGRGMPSLNLITMYSLDGQSDSNIFSHEFTNFIAAPHNFGPKLLTNSFTAASTHEGLDSPLRIPVDLVAAGYPDGSSVPIHQVNSPDVIYLVPQWESSRGVLLSTGAGDDFRVTLASASIENQGTILYEVWGSQKGSAVRYHVANIILSSPFIASEFGDGYAEDSGLFFQHGVPLNQNGTPPTTGGCPFFSRHH